MIGKVLVPDIITLSSAIDLFGQDIADAPNIDREPLANALYAQLKDISLDEFVSYFTNGFEAVVAYANLCAGEKTGQRISLLFNPHRLDTGTKGCPISLYRALTDERFSHGLARVVLLKIKNGVKRDFLYASTAGMGGLNGISYLQEFPPHVARDLALEYNLTKASHVLDPCAGWGGRMLGFSAVVDSYTCCEPSTRTAAGLRKLFGFIRSFRSDFNATIHEAPFEDVQLQNGAYDFAMTSPPYYDTELYAPHEAANSFNRYATFESWVAGFYAPLIHRTMAALKPSACFVLNIGSRVYPLSERLMTIAAGRYSVEKQRGRLSASNRLGKEGEGETFYEVRRSADAIIVPLDESLLTVSNQYTNALDASQRAASSSESFALSEASERQPGSPSHASETVSAPRLSALDFALSSSATSAPSASSVAPIVVPPAPVVPPVDRTFDELRRDLRARGHHILTRDGKLLISNSLQLTERDRADIKQHREALLASATPWAPPPTVATSLAQFLGSEPPRREIEWRADEPPDLSSINEIVLNFATTGFDWAHSHRPIGVTVSTLDRQMTRFLPFAFTHGGNLDEAVIKRWAERELRNKKIYGSKIKFDVHHAREWGVDLEAQGCTFSDIQHTAALLDDHRKRFALDVLAADYLPNERRIARVDESRHADYHASEVAERECYTAQLVGQLRDVLYPQIDEQGLREIHDIEDRVIPAVVEMEKNGAPIDLDLLDQYHRECHAAYDALMLEISHDVGFAFEHTASGWKRLLEHLHLAIPDAFAESDLTPIDHPLVRKGQLASQHASLNSKIFDAYKQHVDADGLLRFDINQLRSDDGGTVSGRFSIGLVQQVPNHDNHTAVFGEQWFPRRLFVGGRRPDGGRFPYLEADAAQIEFRLLVHYTQNARLLQAYKDDPWMSFHKTMQSMLMAYKPDMLYTHTKSYNFAAQYGARSIKLAVMMGFITIQEGQEIREAKRWNDPRLTLIHQIEAAYKQAHPEASALLDHASHLAKPACDKYCKRGDLLHRQYPHRGYVKTLRGRRSRFRPNDKSYIGLNRVLQGTGADAMKVKLAELHDARRETGLVLRITNHDAALGDATTTETREKVSEILNRQSFAELRVPILWTCGTGASWADCK